MIHRERATISLLRCWFLLTGRCVSFRPDTNDLCRVCRIPGAATRKG